MATSLRAVLLLSALVGIVAGQQLLPTEAVSDVCLGCICEAASNCDRTLNCQGEVCGLFRITRPYWIDANMPTIPLDNPQAAGAFERCVNDAVCAAETVKSYMTRFAQDCNRDGVVNCLDYAAIHRLGGYGCSAPIEPEYWNKFNACRANVNNVSPDIDIRQGQNL